MSVDVYLILLIIFGYTYLLTYIGVLFVRIFKICRTPRIGIKTLLYSFIRLINILIGVIYTLLFAAKVDLLIILPLACTYILELFYLLVIIILKFKEVYFSAEQIAPMPTSGNDRIMESSKKTRSKKSKIKKTRSKKSKIKKIKKNLSDMDILEQGGGGDDDDDGSDGDDDDGSDGDDDDGSDGDDGDDGDDDDDDDDDDGDEDSEHAPAGLLRILEVLN